MLSIILLSALAFLAQCTSVRAAFDQEPPLNEPAVQELQHRLTTLDQQVRRRSIPDVFLPITIDVHYHIDSKENITDYAFSRQVQLLNDSYKPANISFRLRTIDRVENKTQAMNYPTDELRQQLHRGDSKSLNIYVEHPTPRLYMGHAKLPPESVENHKTDGVHIYIGAFNDIGGRPDTTVVHEVGHWLGLIHTFQGGCDNDVDDMVEDTPREDDPESALVNSDCKPMDSCPDQPGADSIRNFMGYHKYCRSGFTPGQIRRMQQLWMLYRSDTPPNAEASYMLATVEILFTRPNLRFPFGNFVDNHFAPLLMSGNITAKSSLGEKILKNHDIQPALGPHWTKGIIYSVPWYRIRVKTGDELVVSAHLIGRNTSDPSSRKFQIASGKAAFLSTNLQTSSQLIHGEDGSINVTIVFEPNPLTSWPMIPKEE